MSVTINVNGLTLCHRGSGGISQNTMPDVCKTPSNGVPVPFQNVAYSSDLDNGTTSVFADGGNMIANYGSIFAKSIMDEGGSMGGVVSGTNLAEAEWITHSFDVFFEGKPACRLTDKMFMNHRNTVNMAGEWQKDLSPELVEKICEAICKCRKQVMPPTAADTEEALSDAVDAVRGVKDMSAEKNSNVGNVHRRQACFAEQFNASGIPWYGTKPNDMQVLTEVPYQNGTQVLLSGTARTTGPGMTGPTAPASVVRALSVARGAPGTVTIWDMVVLKNGNLPANFDNVDKIVEIKFAGDKLTPNQTKALKDERVEDKFLRVDEEDCMCDEKEEEERQQREELMKKFLDNLLKYLKMMPFPGPRGLPGPGPMPIPEPVPIPL